MIERNYRGFTLINQTDLPEYESKAHYLKHDKTGMQIFHMLNDDNENLFAFAFDTPPVDSTGLTHILEHSVLCGSKKYPLKDPFLQLSTQSVKTFLNAWTFPDKTVYPASSNVETDYFNLMSVYGDAVFFPLLDEKIFMQEGYHLEISDDGKKTIQGVVYNEMKGAVSSPERIINKTVLHELYKNTCYAFESGGSPECIPHLTYEKFKAYHKAHYNFSNCRLFLYGNIATEKQLDFILENFLTEENISFFDADKSENLYKTPLEYSYICPPEKLTKPESIEISLPPNAPRTSLMSWSLGEASDPFLAAEIIFLTDFLMGHDSAPLTKALLNSGLAQDISPNSDCETEMRYATFSIGLRGIEKENDQKMKDIVLNVLKEIADGKINISDIDSTLMKVEFSNREIRRANGPYSLVLLRRCLCGWLYGRSPEIMLKRREQFAIIKDKIEKTKGRWISDEIKRLFLDNNYRLDLTAFPDPAFAENTEALENENISLLFSKTNEEKVKEVDAMLKKFQAKKESEKERSAIPHIKPEDLTYVREKESLKVKQINNTEFVTCNQNVNGIIYVDYRIPVDVLEAEEYMYLPFLSGLLINIGFDNLSWEEATSKRACTFGSLNASFSGCSLSPVMADKLKITSLTGKAYTNALYDYRKSLGRVWLSFKARFLEEDAEKAIDLLFKNIDKPDFTCLKRIEDIFNEYKNEFTESLVPSGSEYTAGRSCSLFSRFLAQDEIVNGLVQYKAIKRLMKLSVKDLSHLCQTLYEKLRGNGASISVIAEEKNFSRIEKLFEEHVKDYPPLAAPKEMSDEDFFNVLELSDSQEDADKNKTDFEGFTTETRAGFSSMSFPCAPAGSVERAQESVLCHWLSDSFLWEMIRTKGGAYGAWIQNDGIEKMCTMTTYRDPNPEKSLKVFFDALKAAKEAELSNEDFERLITGTYSKLVQPHAPYDKGRIEATRYYYGITESDKEDFIKMILALKKEEVFLAADRLLKSAGEKSRSAVIFNKIKKNLGKNINLVL